MKRLLLAATALSAVALISPARAQNLLGAYVGVPGENSTAADALAAVSNQIGTPQVLTEYVDSSHDMSTWASNAQWSAGLLASSAPNAIPSLGIPMAVAGGNADADFKAIASGSQDAVFNGIFQAYANAGFKNIYIRPGWEMNGNWEPWSVTPANAADFNAAFARIAQLAHNYQGATILTVWNPAAGGGWNGPIDTSSYYPGNDAVDVIGMDQYAANGAPSDAPFDTTTDPTQFTLKDALAMAKANNKPFALPEVGAGTNDTTFAGKMASVIKASGVPIAYAALWDCQCGGTESLMPTDNGPAAQSWKQAFQDMGINTASGPTTLTPSNKSGPDTPYHPLTYLGPPIKVTNWDTTPGGPPNVVATTPPSPCKTNPSQGCADYPETPTTDPNPTLTPVSICNAGQSEGGTVSPTLIPAGYLHTSGSQILSEGNQPIRIASIGVNGATIADNPEKGMQQILLAGFNTIRLPYYNASIDGDLAMYDAYVAAAGKYGIRVIFDQHANESPAPNNGYLPNQPNGLPVDQGPGTDGTDGAGDQGTVNLDRYVSDWVKVAKHYAGNPTVIGFDLHNEPLEYGIGGTVTWGDGGPKDILAMYTAAGNAIQAVNPDALIIAAGPISYHGNYAGTGDAPAGDLSLVKSKPLTLKVPNKVVYTVHEYPAYIGGYTPQSGPDKMATMTASWGYLVAQNIAPVWIGEMGASMDPSDGEDVNQTQAWASTMVAYANGEAAAQGGPAPKDGQGQVHTSWWAWGNLQGQTPNGTLNGDGSLKRAQWDVYKKFQQSSLACAPTVTPAALQKPTLEQVQTNLSRAQDTVTAINTKPTTQTTPKTDAASQVTPAVISSIQASQTLLTQAQADITEAEQIAAQARSLDNDQAVTALISAADAQLQQVQQLRAAGAGK